MVLSASGVGARLEVLRDALARHQPDATVTVAVVEPRPLSAPSGMRVVPPGRLIGSRLRYADLHLGWGERVAAFAAMVEAVEALEPTDDDPVVVLPEAAWVTGALSGGVSSVVTPVGLVPEQVDVATGVVTGAMVPDVLVARSAATPALRAWLDGMVEACCEGHEDVDPWRDVVTLGGPAGALADRGWALTPRSVGHLGVEPAPDGGWTVDGSPLVVAAFPSFDPSAPWWYAEPDAAPRRSVGESPGLRSLCRAYAADVASRRDVHGSLGSDAVVGLPLGERLRRDHRAECLGRLRDGRPLPANPYVPGEVEAFLAWRTGPGDPQRTNAGLVGDGLWDARPDLALAFPRVRGEHQNAFRRWMWTHALSEGLATPIELPDPPSTPIRVAVTHEPRPFGVNLIGYHGSEAGLGVAVRRVGLALDAAHVPWRSVAYHRTSSRQQQVVGGSADEAADHHFSLVLITADQLPLFVADGGGRWLEDHYAIGLWYWEADVMRSTDVQSFRLVDEVWGATTYLADVFRAHTDRPVRHVPLPFSFAEPDRSDEARARLGLDDRFTFLFTFDFLSVAQRKNPLGAIEAYQRAFPEVGAQRLVLKSINGELFPRELERLRDAVADRADIELWDRYVDASDRLSLVALADCYVSLHRSEGLGLTMAEAMAVGTPVVASGYSGNLDFMDEQSAVLVGGSEVLIGPGSYYPAEAHWFEPDLDDAAAALRRVRADAELRDRLSRLGRARIAEFSPAAVGEQMVHRLSELWSAQ